MQDRLRSFGSPLMSSVRPPAPASLARWTIRCGVNAERSRVSHSFTPAGTDK